MFCPVSITELRPPLIILSLSTIAATCTFDSGLCGWTQSKTDDLDWTDGHGRTPSGNTGPSTDHLGSTSGNAVSGLFNAVSDLF